MSPINCIIVDDEQHSIDILKHHVQQATNLNLVLATTNALEAIDVINSQKIDLLFQDVQMPDISGLEVAELIHGRCKVILTTAYSEYALQGYDLNIVDFLLKPISFSRFIKAVQKVATLLQSTERPPTEKDTPPDFMYVKTGTKNKVDKINFEDIEYIESIKNYVMIHHNGNKSLIHSSLKDIEAYLPASRFIRVHKSYIVPYARIVKIDGNIIRLKDIHAEILIGEAYKAHFWEKVRSRIIG